LRARTYVVRRGRYTLVMIHGELDMVSEAGLRAGFVEIIDAAESAGHAAVIVDMCGVSFCDPVGAQILVASAAHAADHGVAFVLASLLPPVRDVFAIIGADRLVSIYDDLQDAVRAVDPT
jgi:anti-anti-sigma factor